MSRYTCNGNIPAPPDGFGAARAILNDVVSGEVLHGRFYPDQYLRTAGVPGACAVGTASTAVAAAMARKIRVKNILIDGIED